MVSPPGGAARLLPERDRMRTSYDMLDRTLDDFDDAGGAAVHVVSSSLRCWPSLASVLDLENCAATGETTDLIYVSPKSVRRGVARGRRTPGATG